MDLINLYVPKDICFEEFAGYEVLIDPTGNWIYTEFDGENYPAYDWYAMSDEERSAGILTPEAFTDPVIYIESTEKKISKRSSITVTVPLFWLLRCVRIFRQMQDLFLLHQRNALKTR